MVVYAVCMVAFLAMSYVNVRLAFDEGISMKIGALNLVAAMSMASGAYQMLVNIVVAPQQHYR